MNGVSANAPAAAPQDFTGVESVEFSGASPTASAHFALTQSANAAYNPADNAWTLDAPGGSVEFRLSLPVLHGVALILYASGAGADTPLTIRVNGVNLVESFDALGPSFATVSWYMPETLLKTGDNSIVVSVPGATTPALLSVAYVMKFIMQPQPPGSSWCWAAVTSSVSQFFADGASDWSQCQLANACLGQTACCTDGASAACDQPWFLSKALTQAGNLACHHAGAQPIESLREQIGEANPLTVLINWNGGGSHFVAVTGVGPDEPGGPGKTLIAVEDSLNGFSYVTYESFVTSYRGFGVWVHSYFTKSES